MLDRQSDPIGVFDSGVGGLSVLSALRSELPWEHFVYVADNAHAPYGERDDQHIITRARAVTQHLQTHHHIKALVVACNTATAAAIQLLRQEYADLPVVGIEPALKPAVLHSKTGKIGVLATRATLASEKFRRLVASLEGQAQVVIQACDGLADAIERNDAIKIEALCDQFTGAMGTFGINSGQIDTLVLGCTHYPFAGDVLRSRVGEAVTFMEGGAPVARQTRRLLALREWLAPAPDCAAKKASRLTLLTTGTVVALTTAVQRWLDCQVLVQQCDID